MSEIKSIRGAYLFTACSDRFFQIGHYRSGKWEDLSDWRHSNASSSSDWNRLEISARGDHFIFTINNEIVCKMTDTRDPAGKLALLVEVSQEQPTRLWFDNFAFQDR